MLEGSARRVGTTEPRGRLLPFREVVLPWLVSRVVSDVLILVMALSRAEPARFAGFGRWDGDWYTLIAQHGYGAAPVVGHESAWAFFPMFPGLIRALSFLGITPMLAGVLISHGALLFGLSGLYRIARNHSSARVGRLAVWTCALFPGAFVFSMVYPSALFLAASVWAFVFIEESRDVEAGLVASVAVLARPNGFVVIIALLIALRSERRRQWTVCLPGILVSAGWCLYCWIETGDLLAFWTAKSGWPEVSVIDFVNNGHKYAVPHLALAAIALTAVIIVWRKVPVAWIALTVLYLVPSLFVGMVGLGRYATECFPPFVAAGDLLALRARRIQVTFFALSLVAQAVCVYWVIHSKWLP